jgi:hypothetical protein
MVIDFASEYRPAPQRQPVFGNDFVFAFVPTEDPQMDAALHQVKRYITLFRARVELEHLEFTIHHPGQLYNLRLYVEYYCKRRYIPFSSSNLQLTFLEMFFTHVQQEWAINTPSIFNDLFEQDKTAQQEQNQARREARRAEIKEYATKLLLYNFHMIEQEHEVPDIEVVSPPGPDELAELEDEDHRRPMSRVGTNKISKETKKMSKKRRNAIENTADQ